MIPNLTIQLRAWTTTGTLFRGLVLGLVLPALSAGCASSGGQSRAETQLETQQNQKRSASHYRMGSGYLREGNVAPAIRELRIAEGLNPGDKWTQLALAEAYRLKGLFELAAVHLRKALDVSPGFHQARLSLSAVSIELGHYAEAVQHTKMLVQDPTFPTPWAALTNQGWAYYKLGQLGPATEALELATQYHDGYWRAILNLGIIEAERGNRDVAMRRFERVLELQPGPLATAEANYRIAEIHVGLGNRGLALTHLTAVTSQRPNGPWGKRSEDYLDRLR